MFVWFAFISRIQIVQSFTYSTRAVILVWEQSRPRNLIIPCVCVFPLAKLFCARCALGTLLLMYLYIYMGQSIDRSIIQTFNYPNVQLFKRSIAQTFSYPNVQLSKRSNIGKYRHLSCSRSIILVLLSTVRTLFDRWYFCPFWRFIGTSRHGYGTISTCNVMYWSTKRLQPPINWAKPVSAVQTNIIRPHTIFGIDSNCFHCLNSNIVRILSKFIQFEIKKTNWRRKTRKNSLEYRNQTFLCHDISARRIFTDRFSTLLH